jgi:hypothetical protein
MRNEGRKMMDRTPAAYGNEDMGLSCAETARNFPKATVMRRKDWTNINNVGHKQEEEVLTSKKKLKII